MKPIIKVPKNLRDIKKEWQAHQLEKDPLFLERREFMGKSAAGITALTFLPSIFALMTKSQTARAANELNSAAIILSLPGGFSASPEVVPLDVAGKFLTGGSYRNLGGPGNNPSLSNAISTAFGAPLWKQGRLCKALEAVRNEVEQKEMQISVAVGWHSNSEDDSPNNASAPAPHIIAAIKRLGTKYRIMGTQVNSNNDGGGYALPTALFPGAKPAVASALREIQNLLTFKKGALANLSNPALGAAAVLAQKLTEGAMQRFKAMNSGRQLSELARSASQELVTHVKDNKTFDPRTDAMIAPFFGISAATPVTDPRVVLAANVKLITDGLSPVMTAQFNNVPFGSFDYHDGNTTWDSENGHHAFVVQTLIPILRACAAAGKSVGIMLSTDGGTSFDDNRRAMGDYKLIHGCIYVFLTKKNGEKLAKFQLGGMRSNDSGGTANTDSNLNILQRHPSYEGHVLTASLLGMQGLKAEDFAVSNISAGDFAKLNLFKS